MQDTAPAQWRIAHALTAEFFAGLGAVETPRTVFAVGDRKQSIFSFQGADAAEFDRARAILGERVRGAGGRWVEPSLNVSFRSTAPVLRLVDAVFAQPAAGDGVVDPGQKLTHYADRAAHAGLAGRGRDDGAADARVDVTTERWPHKADRTTLTAIPTGVGRRQPVARSPRDTDGAEDSSRSPTVQSTRTVARTAAHC